MLWRIVHLYLIIARMRFDSKAKMQLVRRFRYYEKGHVRDREIAHDTGETWDSNDRTNDANVRGWIRRQLHPDFNVCLYAIVGVVPANAVSNSHSYRTDAPRGTPGPIRANWAKLNESRGIRKLFVRSQQWTSARRSVSAQRGLPVRY